MKRTDFGDGEFALVRQENPYRTTLLQSGRASLVLTGNPLARVIRVLADELEDARAELAKLREGAKR